MTEKLIICKEGFLDSEGISINASEMERTGRFSSEGVPNKEIERIVGRN